MATHPSFRRRQPPRGGHGRPRTRQGEPRGTTRRAEDLAAERLLRRLWVSLFLLTLVVLYGILGYCLIERMTLLDALYMTIITISTVGFTEVHLLSEGGRLFTITLILGGTGVSLYALGLAVELLISEQLSHWGRRHRMRATINKMTGHHIICGYGRIGRQVASDLREDEAPFVVVDNKPERCQMLLERGIPFVQGDATLDETLLEAGIERAKGLVGALNADADNVMTVVSARGLNPRLYIIARAALPEAERKLQRAGADEVISPYIVGARRISLAMLRPAVFGFLNAVLYDEKLQAELIETVIAQDSPLVGQTLLEAGLARGRDVVPLALLREGKLVFSPLPDTILQARDTLIVVTPLDSLTMERR